LIDSIKLKVKTLNLIYCYSVFKTDKIFVSN